MVDRADPEGGRHHKAGTTARAPARGLRDRGRYFTLHQMVDAYPIFTPRLARRLVQQRRIPFSRVGRTIVVAEEDILSYIESGRVEPPVPKVNWGSVA